VRSRYFSRETFDFLSALTANNNRDWFLENKTVYEETVRIPALNFISDISGDLAIISPHFLALPKMVGGSLMRVNRDIRFSKDKRPYKTNIGIQFRHETGRDVHAPGFYLHIEKNDCFIGVGIWRPDSATLGKIRDSIVEKSDVWIAARDNHYFRDRFTLEGDALINAPRGYAKDHPLISDLKRKDFIATSNLSEDSVVSSRFLPQVVEQFAQATPLMRFLCRALELRF